VWLCIENQIKLAKKWQKRQMHTKQNNDYLSKSINTARELKGTLWIAVRIALLDSAATAPQ